MNVVTSIEASVNGPALELGGLCKSYRGRRALDDVSFLVPKGVLTVVLGAAGAGKTTLLRTIAGLEQPDSGFVFLEGRESSALEPRDRNLAMIFDNLALYPDKTGFENIASPLRIRGREKDRIEAKVQEVAATLKIAHTLNRKPKTMSGGERQRVALGRALVREPALFLLDEPLSSLDAMLRIELRAELRRLQRELGYTFLLATPDFAEAMAIADTVVMLREGRIVQIADPQALYDAPADREVAKFVGAPEINLLSARFEPQDGGRVYLAGGHCDVPAVFRDRGQGEELAFEAGLRPEHIRLSAPATGDLQGVVADIEPLGINAAVTVRAAEAELRLVTGAGSVRSLAVGEHVGLSIAAQHMLAFDLQTGVRFS